MMGDDDHMAELKQSPLDAEHIYLNATFRTYGDYRIVDFYGEPQGEDILRENGNHPYLCDLSSMGKLRIGGEDSFRFISTMFTADVAALTGIGDSCFSLILTSEAEIIDTVTLIRTGDNEYMVMTNPPNTEEVFAWLEAHSALADEQGKLFLQLTLSNETDSLALVTLFGVGSRHILDELADGALREAPASGSLTMALLDTVPTMIFSSEASSGESFDLFYPANRASGLWRALLSYPAVTPLGYGDYIVLREAERSWLKDVDSVGYQTVDEAGLGHLLRTEHDFVGGKAYDHSKDT